MNQSPSPTIKKEELHKKIFQHHHTKGTSTTNIRHFFFQRHSTKQHKKYSLPFKYLQTSLATTPTSNSKSSTSINTTATKTPPKLMISAPTNPKLTPKNSTFTSVTDKQCNNVFQKKTSLAPSPPLLLPPPLLPPH